MPGVMWKAVSDNCNLACDYCYYSECGGRPGPNRIVDDALLDKVVREYMQQSRGSIGFVWQGGEPLLSGKPFFEKVVALQAQYAPPGTSISNAVQTNGTALSDDWARFFRTYNFLVGVSIDGPREIHDAHRMTAGGRGTFDLVMRRIGHLRQHNVDFNVLTVLHSGNIGRASELMAFYEREDIRYVQFIPGMDFRAHSPETPPRYLITAREYGRFLCEAFNIWHRNGAPNMSVRFFDNVLSVYLGRDAETCAMGRTCSRTLVLEQNGDAYPCDFYLGPEYRLGNLASENLDEIPSRSVYQEFLKLKGNLPGDCRACRHLRLCYGGCPRNRIWSDNGTCTPDYFCDAYRQFFDYTSERYAALATSLRRRWLMDYERTGAALPERNAPCFCGSGRKFKRCCRPFHDAKMSPD